MTAKNEYIDLVYFDNDTELQDRFITDIQKDFKSVKLENCHHERKGLRQEVTLPNSEENNYHTWLMSKEYYRWSLTMTIMYGLDNEKFNKFKIKASKK